LYFKIIFETEYYCADQAGLELTLYPRMALNSPSFSFSLPNAGKTVMYHYAGIYKFKCFSGLCKETKFCNIIPLTFKAIA
jgi:hypothetical protein